MALFALSKLILQTRMRSHPVELDVWCLVGPFVYFHISCVRTAKALARLPGCAGSPEPSLVVYVISTIISWAGSNNNINDVAIIMLVVLQRYYTAVGPFEFTSKGLSLTIFGPRQANLVLIAYASSEGSGEPAHPRSLARTSAARSYTQWIKRDLETQSQIPGPAEWLGMRSWNLSWRNARRHKFA